MLAAPWSTLSRVVACVALEPFIKVFILTSLAINRALVFVPDAVVVELLAAVVVVHHATIVSF
jgi:hypothetical protein